MIVSLEREDQEVDQGVVDRGLERENVEEDQEIDVLVPGLRVVVAADIVQDLEKERIVDARGHLERERLRRKEGKERRRRKWKN